MFIRTRIISSLWTMGIATIFAIAGAAVPASAHSAGEHDGSATPAPTTSAPKASSKGTVFLTAKLNGSNEIPVENGPAVGDPDAKATAVIRIRGNEVCFALSWEKTAPLTLGHIHAGEKGVNGPVRIPLFGSALPETLNAVSGCTTADAAVVDAVKANPRAYYVNLHSTEFPGGAVRGQLKKSSAKSMDLNKVFRKLARQW